MKANKLLFIALAGILSAAAVPRGVVFAASDGESTIYPQDFECDFAEFLSAKDGDENYKTVLQDYAVCGDTVAFAYNTTITVLSYDGTGERKRNDFTHGSGVTRLDYDADGNLYFKNALQETYLYTQQLSPVESYEFQSLEAAHVSISDSVFYTLEQPAGELSYWNNSNRKKVGEGFSLIKKYGETVYCIKDNLVYKITQDVAELLKLNYTDFSDADKIVVGSAAEALKSQDYTVKMARLDSGKYYTQIDPDELGGKYFKQLHTKKSEGEMTCLVLCQSGDSTVFATKDGCFLTATANLHDEPYTPPPLDWNANKDGERLAYAVLDTAVYASPYMSGCTEIAKLKSGSENKVTVLEKVEKRVLNFLNCDYYRVSFKDDGGNTVTGFVAANFLTEYTFGGEDTEIKPPATDDFKYDTNVTTVVLVVIVVALVLIAILYITLISTSKKTEKKRKKAKKKRDKDDTEEDEQPEETDNEAEE